MKKLVLTIAIVLGMTMGASAQLRNNAPAPGAYGEDGKPVGGGLFGRGDDLFSFLDGDSFLSPEFPGFGETEDQDADAPLGSGALLLVGFGAAYAMAKKNRKE